jgi:hypothetical protein
MGNASRRKRKQRRQEAAKPSRQPWMQWRTGMIALTLVSLALALFVGWQIYPAGGLGQAALIGLAFGFSIWVIFYIVYRLNRWLQSR